MSPNSDHLLVACEASAWQGENGRCRWCNRECEGRRSRWCTDACYAAFANNHFWGPASHAAKTRDGFKCIREDCTNLRGLSTHHIVPLSTLTIEVYGETRKVKHSDGGCWHHLDGLESLCELHHWEAHRRLEVRDPDQLMLL